MLHGTSMTMQWGVSHIFSVLVEGVMHCVLSKPSSSKRMVFMADTKDVNTSHLGTIGNIAHVCILSAADTVAPAVIPKHCVVNNCQQIIESK